MVVFIWPNTVTAPISSKSGSADVLEALGINLDLKPAELGKVFDKTGIVFLFAKKYAPSYEIHHASSFGIGNSNDYELDWSTDSSNGFGNTASLVLVVQNCYESTAQVIEKYGSQTCNRRSLDQKDWMKPA